MKLPELARLRSWLRFLVVLNAISFAASILKLAGLIDYPAWVGAVFISYGLASIAFGLIICRKL